MGDFLSAIIYPWLDIGLPPRCPQVVWCHWLWSARGQSIEILHCHCRELNPSHGEDSDIHLFPHWAIKSNLSSACFCRTNLSSACFRRTNLSSACFRRTNLSTACFCLLTWAQRVSVVLTSVQRVSVVLTSAQRVSVVLTSAQRVSVY